MLSPARVEVEEIVGVGQREPAEREEGKGVGDWVGRLIRQLSMLYGYATIAAGINIGLVLILAELVLTEWKVNGKTGSSIGLFNASSSLSNTSPLSNVTANAAVARRRTEARRSGSIAARHTGRWRRAPRTQSTRRPRAACT